MRFEEVIRKQRMTRRFDPRPIPPKKLRELLAKAQKAPSAGYTQGVAMLVLEGEGVDLFWKTTAPEYVQAVEDKPPVIILPLASKQAYLDRYSEPDKAGTGMHKEEAWPAPYWTIDCAFASMVILLAATAEGLGCWFFGIFRSEDELLSQLEVPSEFKPIGAIALGYPALDSKSPSLKRGRKPFDDFVHFGRW
ncbi:MAG: nitroreductase family protein [Acidimicrobiia bacterium]